MTWKLVTMWPASSQTKPVPVPLGCSLVRSEKKSRCTASVVMCTTEGETRLKTPMLFISSASSALRVLTARGWAAFSWDLVWAQAQPVLNNARSVRVSRRLLDMARANSGFGWAAF
jgi:hypothetical protein